jgi:small subunit ribosomal protein S16
MLKIRLQRVGRKHEPSFRLVLTDSKNSTKSGRFGEVLGSYDARKTNEKFDAERIKNLLSQGVGLTPTVNNLLIKHGIIRGKKVNVANVPVVVASAAPEAVSAPAEAPAEAPAAEEPSNTEVV